MDAQIEVLIREALTRRGPLKGEQRLSTRPGRERTKDFEEQEVAFGS
ncbi:hypothetical protein KXS07_02305 [Inquilinus limosus]